jgi:CBS domain-containing protein
VIENARGMKESSLGSYWRSTQYGHTHGELNGVLTDRDICMAINDDGRLPEMRVGQIANRPTFRCAEDDDVGDALAVMSDHQVRRLPGSTAGAVSRASCR